ncbi:unnamed protein product [Eruca vesicaria subsp. sativa]|uniref:Uncharacterized protein n=1 Tax=Eruca vesicaria subsp. sativa TaxID=29727 RepID=A0ABC8KM37_ERUVS|nr:unnamed protein product [Eruca vesicaria subsp. sativa]
MLMPHIQRMAMERRILQGHATFQLSPEGKLPRKRCRPSRPSSAAGEPPRVFTGKCQDELRGNLKAQLKGILEPLEFALVKQMVGFAIEAEEKITAELTAIARSEKGNAEKDLGRGDGDLGASGKEPPKKKRGRPRKSTSASGDCDCDVLVQMVQNPRKVKDYLDELLETKKKCQPKPTEEWCRIFKAGLRGDIQDELAGVLEPLEFSLVKGLAGLAFDAEELLAKKNA